MRIDAPAAGSGVAGETVTFGVATDAGLQVLPGRGTVADNEELQGVVIAGAQLAGGVGESRRLMASGTVRAWIVAVTARRDPIVGCGGMFRQKPVPMISRRARCRIRAMAIETVLAGVTPGACGRRRRSLIPM
jgi:hypothetical protein